MRTSFNLSIPRSLRTRARSRLLLAVAGLGVLLVSDDARAQITGTTNKQIPNVLLLVDNSGSMERMGDNSLPSENKGVTTIPNACNPGVESNPNRWGMLLQALTGNIQPFYSCDAMSRAKTPATPFVREYQINLQAPYDADYFIPYHRPLSGAIAPTDRVCAVGPWNLPGTGGNGVGPARRGAGGNAEDFPTNALMSVPYTPMKNAYSIGSAYTPTATDGVDCQFEQANDGQLDLSKDFIRFGMMTFDNDPDQRTNVATAVPAGGAYDTVNPFNGQWSYVPEGGARQGWPNGCTTSAFFELGARHRAAPPWEGRMVPFAPALGTLFDIQRTNEQVQRVLVASRPYGATPIDGMMDDAKDYLTVNTQFGPWSGAAATRDMYVQGGCRDQYIILLTDGAPNQNLRPSCQGGGGNGPVPLGNCPYKRQGFQIAEDLYANTPASGKHVETFVIGFSVNGYGDTNFPRDGFPNSAPYNDLTNPNARNCKAWYTDTGANGGKNNPVDMDLACTATAPGAGSTADACCQLNKIALYGSGGPAGKKIGPFFAESQRDLALAFGSILASVTKVASTRTVPGYSPVATLGTSKMSGRYVASFIPNTQKVWSGEIDRVRSQCNGITPADLAQSPADGDSYAVNTAKQAAAGNRLFITAEVPAETAVPGPGSVRDSAGSIRYPGAADTIATQIPKEVGAVDLGLLTQLTNPWEAMDIDDNTCKTSKGFNYTTQKTVTIPKLTKDKCANVVWGFAAAHRGAQTEGTSYDFNVRCRGTGAFDAGRCSFSNATCSVSSGGSSPCTVPGEVCVPECSALGAVFRSSPTVVGPPEGLLRDEGFRAFQAARARRRPAMYVATADGILHAFKALPDDPATPTNDHELWAFVPPAVLPKLASNYPSGSQILLDGTPAVRDVVWERQGSALGDSNDTAGKNWHTTLVAGMGASGAGYYALNVTDTDCGGSANASACLDGANGFRAAGSLAEASTSAVSSGKAGPHFLWQLTDFEQQVGDKAKPSRKAKNGKQMVSLFGAQSGTPAITTVLVDKGSGNLAQIGVAILPGGVDGPPERDNAGNYLGCDRATQGGYGAFSAADDLASPGSEAKFKTRKQARKWTKGSCATGPVPGRGVTLVRLDNGEILRHFGRRTQDVPKVIENLTTDSPFDSPIIGTPTVYPNLPGVAAQKIFVGDADGTIWRIDVSSTSISNWKVHLFQDLAAPSGVNNISDSQPITAPIEISQSPTGSLVLTASTGDQENIVASDTELNSIWAVEEVRPDATNAYGTSRVRWYQPLEKGKRVTGPLVVFDRAVFFATFQPEQIGSLCGGGSKTELWGLDYYNAKTSASAGEGGQPRWCPRAQVTSTGNCAAAFAQNEDVSNDPDVNHGIIPGVTLRATLSCANVGSSADNYGQSITGLTGTEFHLFTGVTTARGPSSGNNLKTDQASRLSIKRPAPRVATVIDAWSLVVD